MTHDTFERTHQFDQDAETRAEPFGVAADIHPADYVFSFVLNESGDEAAALDEYFKGGADAALWLKRMIATFRSVDEPFSLLEFAAGYGRVSRHIPKVLPNAKLVASDIHAAAVEFLPKLGVAAHQSSAMPQTFSVDQRFDVILALSFFTHMPKASWAGWLRALLRQLQPGGCMIFTTHGVPGMKVMSEAHGRALSYDDDGFWYEPLSEQADIDTSEYGSTGTSFRFVRTQVESAGASLFLFQERGAGCQDVYVVRAADPADDRRDSFVRANRNGLPRRGRPREAKPEDCIFYHSSNIPGVGEVHGQWDLRGSEKDCLGHVDLKNRSVLEVGPASGYLSFWMEKEGARVTSFDLDDSLQWDLVPFAGREPATIHARRSDLIRKVNNSWWYTRAALGSKAGCFNGTAYDVDETLGDFDVVTINSVLLHLRDPLMAIERAAARSRHQMVITEVSERQFSAGRPDLAGELAVRFIPRAAEGGPDDAWWYLPSALVIEYMKILGFESVVMREFKAKFQDGHYWDLYTVVGTRPQG